MEIVRAAILVALNFPARKNIKYVVSKEPVIRARVCVCVCIREREKGGEGSDFSAGALSS